MSSTGIFVVDQPYADTLTQLKKSYGKACNAVEYVFDGYAATKLTPTQGSQIQDQFMVVNAHNYTYVLPLNVLPEGPGQADTVGPILFDSIKIQ